MGSLTSANSSPLSWNDIEAPSFTTTGYNPVMAIAQNHIHFLDVPGNAAGTANIFVIHCELALFANLLFLDAKGGVLMDVMQFRTFSRRLNRMEATASLLRMVRQPRSSRTRV